MRCDITDAAAFYCLDLLPVDDLPEIAVQALESGYDSRSLRELAGGVAEHPFDLRERFEKALKELQIPFPSRRDAAILLACRIAQSILREEISPYEGAKRIWWDLYGRVPEASELRVFVGPATEIEENEYGHDYYNSVILKECTDLLANRKLS